MCGARWAWLAPARPDRAGLTLGGVLALCRALLAIPGALGQLLQFLWRLLGRLFRHAPKRPGRVDKAAQTRCVPIDDPAMRTPDPAASLDTNG